MRRLAETAGTRSVCPVCLRALPAERVLMPDGSVRMRKNCPEHGHFETVLWRGRYDLAEWLERADPPAAGSGEERSLHCHACTGLCGSHLRNTCCTLLEVTRRCNMRCRYCFAGDENGADPPLARVKAQIFDLTRPGETFLQLSGGEPTVREDLPEIISFARKAGCRYVQLNTNGLRLTDEDYVRSLAEAGLDIVFLSFDGTGDGTYRFLRGRDMMETKEEVIRLCGKYGIGVTLVPVIVPGVNEKQIGDILRFAAAHAPEVKAVHFQPVSYFGRLPDVPVNPDRFTLDDLLYEIERQTEGEVSADSLAPSCCDHPLCGFHGSFVVLPGGTLMPLTAGRKKRSVPEGTGALSPRTGRGEAERSPVSDPAGVSRKYIGTRWAASAEGQRTGAAGPGNESSAEPVPGHGPAHRSPDMTDMDTFLSRVRTHRLTISSMAFQDAGNYDFERLRRCSLHVYRDGRHIPFCANYLSPWGE